MLQLLRSTPRKNTDDAALDALFNQLDLTTRLSDNYRWMTRLNDFSSGLHQGFYPISTDGFKRAENFKSCRATLRCIRGL